ncbi:MAG: hypothetical protein PF439_10865 [Helicobacteraceae bacterium]|jgi:hypothetical protein|nr:hypothetical protein [Helicobacteraceae bacterium]
MLKKVLISGLFCLSIATTANANGYDLATNMKMLASTFLSVQEGFLSNDKASTLVALDKFQKEVDDLLGDKRNIERLLPEDLKHKASMATNTATLMDKYVNEIREDLNDKDMSMIDRQNKTQKIFLNIEGQCFRCHNMVRDWE